MNKPEKRTKEFYDYHDCIKYVEHKHGYETRGFLFPDEKEGEWNDPNKPPYRDFWHWVIDGPGCGISNGSFFWLTNECLLEEDEAVAEGEEPWIEPFVRKILNDILNEFGEENSEYPEYKEIEFYVSW